MTAINTEFVKDLIASNNDIFEFNQKYSLTVREVTSIINKQWQYIPESTELKKHPETHYRNIYPAPESKPTLEEAVKAFEDNIRKEIEHSLKHRDFSEFYDFCIDTDGEGYIEIEFKSILTESTEKYQERMRKGERSTELNCIAPLILQYWDKQQSLDRKQVLELKLLKLEAQTAELKKQIDSGDF